MKITFLGTGTSLGIPVLGCECPVCASQDPKNKRLRSSIFVEGDSTNILVDTSPDLRQQMFRFGYKDLDAVMYTHAHADHIFGLDDLRGFNFRMQRALSLYADNDTADSLESIFSYAFFPDPNYLGGAPPKLQMNRIRRFEEINVGNVRLLPLPVLHGKQIVTAYRIGAFGYLTDCSGVPDETRDYLKNLDVLVLSALRHRPHATHFSVSEALVEIEKLGPKQAVLTHISHDLDHAETNDYLRANSKIPVSLAYDELVLEV